VAKKATLWVLGHPWALPHLCAPTTIESIVVAVAYMKLPLCLMVYQVLVLCAKPHSEHLPFRGHVAYKLVQRGASRFVVLGASPRCRSTALWRCSIAYLQPATVVVLIVSMVAIAAMLANTACLSASMYAESRYNRNGYKMMADDPTVMDLCSVVSIPCRLTAYIDCAGAYRPYPHER
jgi:hypothetical protein